MTFRDDDPEDAYAATDPPMRHLHVVERLITTLESGPEVDERPTGRFRGRVGIADAILDRLQRAREIDPNAIRTLINRLDKVKQQWLAT